MTTRIQFLGSNCVVGSGGSRLPCSTIAEHSVEGCDHFSHDIDTGIKRQSTCSLDHLVGEREQPVRNLEAERLRRLEIDDQFELRWLLNGKIGGLFTFKDTTGAKSDLSVLLYQA